MSINFETLKAFMPEIGLKNCDTSNEQEMTDRIVAGFKCDTTDREYPSVKAGVVVSLQEDGEFIQIQLIRILDEDTKIMDSPNLHQFMQYLLDINYKHKIGRWCLDPFDGDLYVDSAIPVEDNAVVTLAQVKRLMTGLVSNVREAYAPMNRILKTGSPNAPKSRDDLIKDILLKLVELQKFELMSKVAEISDRSRLLKILNWLNEGNMRAVEVEFLLR